jgi:non-homologous end joining protein Ku
VRLSLTTMRFYDEVRPLDGVPLPKRKRPSKAQVDQTISLIDALACLWDPDRYEDAYEKRLKRILPDKQKARRSRRPSVSRRPGPSTI